MKLSLKVGSAVLLIWLLALPLVAIVGYFGYFQLSSRILPRVQVGDTRLGGKQAYDAAVHLNKSWNMERNIVVGAVVAGEILTWDLPPGEGPVPGPKGKDSFPGPLPRVPLSGCH